jgi:TPR repeat protein
LLDGTEGLRVNIPQGFRCLQQLVRMDVDVVNHYPVYHPDQTCSRHNDTIAALAMRKMASLYLENDEYRCDDESLLPQSNAIGLAWLECAFAVASDVDAAHELALIYEYAKYGVETDPVAAARYFEKAATAGHIEAMAELALCYELGCGVEASDEQALDWYMKAAEAGHVTAKYSVGEIFEEARGVPKSDEEACLWYYKAAVEGDEDSRKALRRLEDIARIVCPGVRALLDG